MSSPALRLIIFDLDGTLVDAYQPVAGSLNYALKRLGYESLNDETIKRSVGWGDKNLLARFVRPDDLEKTLAIYRRHHKIALRRGTKFLPGARSLITFLRARGYKLAVASNRPTVFTRIILKHLKVLDQFSMVLCADKAKRPKPAGDMLKAIFKKLAVAPAQALYVGDMTIDVDTGRNAGVRTVAVATGSCTREELIAREPFRLISSLKELRDVLKIAGFRCRYGYR